MTARKSVRAPLPRIVACLLRTVVCIILYAISRIGDWHGVHILMYHSVDNNGSIYTVTPKEFCSQMDYVRRNYSIVSLDQIVDFVNGKSDLPRRAVAITFDDGYRDNFYNVYPYLRKYKLPATIFVCTGSVGKQMSLGGVTLNMLDWKQISEMAQNQVLIGAHSVTHPDLSVVDAQQAVFEIVESKMTIERELGQHVRYFAYPAARYNDDVVRLVASLGFHAAFSGQGGIHKGDKRFALCRIPIDRTIPLFLFRIRLAGTTAWYGRLRLSARLFLGRFGFLKTELIHKEFCTDDRTMSGIGD